MPDSYFGNIGNSFYAGPNGASFQIKNNAKFGNYRELLANNVSTILIGDYLLVNYGSQVNPDASGAESLAPNGKSYNLNKAIDAYDGEGEDPETLDIPALDEPGYYNATIWQKSVNSSSNIVYNLIFQAISAAPDIQIEKNQNDPWIDPGEEDPSDIITKETDISSMETQTFYLKTIKPWDVEKGSNIVRTPGQGPTVTIDRKNNPTDEDNNTTKYVHFGIPDAWDIQKGESLVVNPSEDPDASIDRKENSTDADSNTTKYIHFGIPKAWDIQKGSNITRTPGQGPDASIDRKQSSTSSDSDTIKYIHFGIPDTWNIQKGQDITLYPKDTTTPQITIDRKNNPTDADSDSTKYVHFGIPKTTYFNPPSIKLLDSTKTAGRVEGSYDENQGDHYNLTFSIPRGTKIIGGTAFETGWTDTVDEQEFILTSALAELKPEAGDLYINTIYGYLLQVQSTREVGETKYITLKNKGAIQLNGFNINSSPIEPVYVQDETSSIPTWIIDDSAMDLSGTVTKPSATSDKWGLNLPVIKPPAFSGTSQIVGSNETGKIEIKPNSNGNIITYSIQIPRGSRIFYSSSAPTSQSGLLPGDYWFNPDTNEFTRILNSSGGTGESVSLAGKSFSLYTQNIEEEGVQIVKSRWLVNESDLEPYSAYTDLTQKIGQWLNAQNVTPLSLVQAVDVLYTDDSDESAPQSFSYWFYRNANTWYSIRLSASSASSFIVHDTTSDPNKVYDTVFVNSINSRVGTNAANISSINTQLTEINSTLATKQNATQVQSIVDNTIDTALSWGSWNDQGVIE